MISFRSNFAAISMCISVLMVSGSAQAWSPAPELDPLIRDLGSDDPLVREAASQKLGEPGVTDLKSLFAAMKRKPLSLEQHKRLEAAARPLFESFPRAGLGVSFDRQVEDGSVRIIGTIDGPGFHAHEFLKSGDIVRELDGLPVHSQEQARGVILSHDPGDIMDVLVIRQGTPIRAAIKLGSYADLEANRGLGGVGRFGAAARDLQNALRVRILRELGDQAEQSGAAAIDSGLNAESWDVLYRKIQLQRNRRIEKEGRAAQPFVASLTAGGTGRLALVDATHQNPRHLESRLTIQDRQFLADEIAQRKAQHQELLKLVDTLKIKLQQPDIGAKDQAATREQLMQVRAWIEDVEVQIRELDRRLNGR